MSISIASSSESSSDSVTIAVMGPTGAGKSTFINLATGQPQQEIGEELESCTADVTMAPPFLLDGKTVNLIDTPGFDDTKRSEAEILGLIVEFLSATYEEGRTLHGVIFLHRISDNRMGGIARRNFRIFRKLCGETTLKHVVIATTMWDDVTPALGAKREKGLATNEPLFKPALDKGARLVRHDNTAASAHEIIRSLMGLEPARLQIQRETVDENKALIATEAGQALKDELERQAGAASRDIEQLRAEVDGAFRRRDEQHRAEMEALRSEMRALMREKDELHLLEVEELRAALDESQSKLKKAEDEVRKLRGINLSRRRVPASPQPTPKARERVDDAGSSRSVRNGESFVTDDIVVAAVKLLWGFFRNK